MGAGAGAAGAQVVPTLAGLVSEATAQVSGDLFLEPGGRPLRFLLVVAELFSTFLTLVVNFLLDKISLLLCRSKLLSIIYKLFILLSEIKIPDEAKLSFFCAERSLHSEEDQDKHSLRFLRRILFFMEKNLVESFSFKAPINN